MRRRSFGGESHVGERMGVRLLTKLDDNLHLYGGVEGSSTPPQSFEYRVWTHVSVVGLGAMLKGGCKRVVRKGATGSTKLEDMGWKWVVPVDRLACVRRGKECVLEATLQGAPAKMGSVLKLEVCAYSLGEEEEAEEEEEHEQFPLVELDDARDLVVDVELLEVRDLPGIECDPHAIVSHGGKSYTTPATPKCNNIAWNPPQDCTFYIDKGGDLTLSCMFWSDSFLGGCVLSLNDPLFRRKNAWRTRRARTQWVQLTRDKRYSGWLRILVSVSVAGEPGAMLDHCGSPLHSLPFRVNLGDCLLLDTVSLGGKIISAVTATKWDHCGLVVTVGKHGTLYLMEAKKDGCYAYPLDSRVASALKLGSVVGVRRLVEIGRSAKFVEHIKNFVAEHEGKPYLSNISTLAKSALKKNHDDGDLESFFCSELVAAGYKALGVLAEGALCSNYCPKDFVQEHVAHMERGRFDVLKVHSERGGSGRRSASEIEGPLLLSPRVQTLKLPGRRRSGVSVMSPEPAEQQQQQQPLSASPRSAPSPSAVVASPRSSLTVPSARISAISTSPLSPRTEPEAPTIQLNLTKSFKEDHPDLK